MKVKTCKHCGEYEPNVTFYKHKGICKLCTSIQHKVWRNNNPEKVKDGRRRWELKNVDYRRKYKREYLKTKRKSDNLFKIRSSISRLIRMTIYRNGYTKKSKATEILDCSFNEFKIRIESLWEPWMNWDNYGKYNGEFDYGWDIDHIIPSTSGKTEDDIINLNHYTNLQPLCSKINREIKRENYIRVGK